MFDFVFDGVRVGMRLHPYPGDEARQLIKQLYLERGGVWYRRHRYWGLADPDGTRTRDILKQLADNGLPEGCQDPGSADVGDALDAAIADPKPGLLTGHLQVRLVETLDGGTIAEFDYDPGLIALAKSLSGKWMNQQRAWDIHCSAEHLAEQFVEKGGVPADNVFVYPGTVRMIDLDYGGLEETAGELDLGEATSAKALAKRSTEHDVKGVGVADTTPLEQLPVDEKRLMAAAERFTLYDFQVEGVRHMVGHSSCLLADDMGLGKTRQSIVAATLATDQPVVIVCPSSLQLNWNAELVSLGWAPEEIGVVGYNYRPEDEAMPPWVIVSYDRVPRMLGQAATFGVALIDEAHSIKEYTAQRTRNALQLAGAIPHRILITATPIMNRIDEIHTLFRAGGHPLGEMEVREFRETYDGNRSGLYAELKAWMIRRYKGDLTPGKYEEPVTISPESSAFARYQEIMARVDLAGGVKLNYLMRELERMKVPAIADMIMACEDKAIIFCGYKDVVRELEEALKIRGCRAVKLLGGMSATARNNAVQQFQNDDDIGVFLGTTQAAGVGITLTAAAEVFFTGVPWTPAAKAQAEDRANRIGQSRRVRVRLPLVEGTIDEALRNRFEAKTELTEEVMDGRVSEGAACEAVAEEVLG